MWIDAAAAATAAAATSHCGLMQRSIESSDPLPGSPMGTDFSIIIIWTFDQCNKHNNHDLFNFMSMSSRVDDACIGHITTLREWISQSRAKRWISPWKIVCTMNWSMIYARIASCVWIVDNGHIGQNTNLSTFTMDRNTRWYCEWRRVILLLTRDRCVGEINFAWMDGTGGVQITHK